MNILKEWMRRREWHWVGTAVGESRIVNEAGQMRAGGDNSRIYNLFERADGKRKSVLVAGDGNSFNARAMMAAVCAWEKGGPLPKLVQFAEPPKTKGKLFVIPGGKGGAA